MRMGGRNKKKQAKRSQRWNVERAADGIVIGLILLIFVHLFFGSPVVEAGEMKVEILNLRLLIVATGLALYYRQRVISGAEKFKARGFISRYRYELILLVFVILFLGARSVGVSYGLPHMVDYDEQTIVTHTFEMVKTGSLNPGFFIYGAIYFYLMFASFTGYFLMTHAKVVPFAEIGNVPLGEFYAAARGVNVALSALSIVLVYIVAKRYADKKIALATSIALGFSLSHYIVSTTVRPDMLVLVFLLSAYYFIMRVAAGGKTGDYIWSAVFIALAMGTKYYGMFMLVSLAVAHFIAVKEGKTESGKWRLLAWSAVLVPVIFIVTNPFIILDFNTFMRDSAIMMRLIDGLETHWSSATGTVGQHYLSVLFWFGFGYVGGILALFAVAWLVFRPNKRDALLMTFPLVHFFVMTGSRQVHHRFFLLLLPFLMMLTFKTLRDWLNRFGRKFNPEALYWLTLVVIIAYPGFQIARTVRMYTIPSTSDTAYEWIEKNIAAGSSLLCRTYTVSPDKSKYRFDTFKNPRQIKPADINKPGSGFQYIVLRDGEKKYGLRDQVFARVEPVFRTQGDGVSRSGRDIAVLRIKPSSRYALRTGSALLLEKSKSFTLNLGVDTNDGMYLNSSWPYARKDRNGKFRAVGHVPAQFYFKLSENAARHAALKLTLDIAPFNPESSLRVRLNGKVVSDFKLGLVDSRSSYTAELPAGLLKYGVNGVNEIELDTFYTDGTETRFIPEKGLWSPRVKVYKITLSGE